MGYENPIRTLGDYSRPSHEGYRNTIELPDGNNVVPLRSDTIRLVQNRCSFHGLRSEDSNQHLKDFLKFVDSLDLDVANRERKRLCLFQFSLRDQASNWLEQKRLDTPITKNVNAISLVIMEKEKNIKNNMVVDKNVIELSESNAIEPKEEVDMKKEVGYETNNEPIRSVEEEITGDGIEELVEMPRSRHIGYYLKHEINKKLIEGLINNQRYNDSLLATRLGKMDYETYNSLPVGPMYDAILKKKITKKEDMGGNFVIPCNVRGLKYMDALVDQGSDIPESLCRVEERAKSDIDPATLTTTTLETVSGFPDDVASPATVKIVFF
ncbi:hypothetical protein Tco_1336237 [Tanacetum coccineum]